MGSQLLSKTVFREAICEGWKFDIASAERKILDKPLVKLEFEWNSDGSLLAIRRLLTCPICKSDFQQKRPGHEFCSNRCWQRANSARLNKKRRDKYKLNSDVRKKELDRCKRYYYERGGRKVRINYQRRYKKNRFSILAGTPLNLKVCMVNGQPRIVDAVRLERAVKYGWRNSPFNVHEER